MRLGKLLLVLLALMLGVGALALLAGSTACDSGGSSDGAATGYSLADLAGVWAARVSDGGYERWIIDQNGHMRSCVVMGSNWTPGLQFRVFSDGRVTGKGWQRNRLMPAFFKSFYYRFSGKFINRAYVVGTLKETWYGVTDTMDYSLHKQ